MVRVVNNNNIIIEVMKQNDLESRIIMTNSYKSIISTSCRAYEYIIIAIKKMCGLNFLRHSYVILSLGYKLSSSLRFFFHDLKRLAYDHFVTQMTWYQRRFLLVNRTIFMRRLRHRIRTRYYVEEETTKVEDYFLWRPTGGFGTSIYKDSVSRCLHTRRTSAEDKTYRSKSSGMHKVTQK